MHFWINHDWSNYFRCIWRLDYFHFVINDTFHNVSSNCSPSVDFICLREAWAGELYWQQWICKCFENIPTKEFLKRAMWYLYPKVVRTFSEETPTGWGEGEGERVKYLGSVGSVVRIRDNRDRNLQISWNKKTCLCSAVGLGWGLGGSWGGYLMRIHL